MFKNLRGDKFLLKFYSSETLEDRIFLFNFLLSFYKTDCIFRANT